MSTKPATCMSTECSLLQLSLLCPLSLLRVCPLSILLQHEPSVSTKPATCMSTEHFVQPRTIQMDWLQYVVTLSK